MSAKLVGHGNAGPSAIQMAAVVELLHAATLVHDDVIDAAETRRGRPSSNVNGATTPACWPGTGCICRPSRSRCGNAIPDSRFADRPHANDGGGELLQLERIGRIDITEADCMELVDRKTARLFRCALGWRGVGAQ